MPRTSFSSEFHQKGKRKGEKQKPRRKSKEKNKKSKEVKMNKSVNIDSKNFEKEVLNSGKPVIIDFYAEWCGSCKAVSRAISELADELTEKIKFFKVDISKNPEFAKLFNITSLPTILFIKEGKEVARKNGSASKIEFKNLIQLFLFK